VAFVRTTKSVNDGPQDTVWVKPEEEVQVFVTNLTAEEAATEQAVHWRANGATRRTCLTRYRTNGDFEDSAAARGW
jgi:hypothetical protein